MAERCTRCRRLSYTKASLEGLAEQDKVDRLFGKRKLIAHKQQMGPHEMTTLLLKMRPQSNTLTTPLPHKT